MSKRWSIRRGLTLAGIVGLLTLLPLLPARPVQAEAAPAGAEIFTYGYSVEGRPLQALRFGTGPRNVVIAGAIHGSEGNTADLVNRMVAHFATIQHLLPPDLSLYFIPVANPDGLEKGSRYNANGVDLNRNWESDDWQPDSVDSSGRVSGGGGPAPFSEPETKSLADLLWSLRSEAAPPPLLLVYHSQYPPRGLVLSGTAGLPTIRAFAAITGYAASGGGRGFSAYSVTGSTIGWCDNVGLRCFDLELPNRANVSEASLQRNALAVLSVLLWEQTAPGQRCFAETGFCLSGRGRSFWEQNGGAETFGLPITRQQEVQRGEERRQVQWFERARLELYPENAPPYDVQLGRLGEEMLTWQERDWWTFPRSEAREECRYFPETGHNICGGFLEVWQSTGLELDGQRGTSEAESLALLGLPLSDAQPEQISNGQIVTVQWFERARLEFHPDAAPNEQVRLSLLGRELLEQRGEL